MRSVLFVCSANQLRSPLAEVLFKEIVRRKGAVDAWQFGSAGVWALGGSPAALSAMSAAAARGLNLSTHVARRVTRELLEQSDLVLVMEREHLEAIHEEWPALDGRVHLLSRMAGEVGEVEDPIGLPSERVRALVIELERLLEAGWPRILQRTGRGATDDGEMHP
ncbi:MAG: low molecular weight protein arginine phosphatase [Chloroflexi bacterium]|nr:low molecular weight protein arginine phosphatase [Chloroflexota bacterium]